MTTLKPKVQIKLKKHEHIIAVVPEYCDGPGWSNRVLWVHIADGNSRTYRTEAIQPDERNRDQVVLFKAGEAMHQALVGSVVVKKEKQFPNRKI